MPKSARQVAGEPTSNARFEELIDKDSVRKSALADAGIGVWQFVISTDRLSCDETAARLLDCGSPLSPHNATELFERVHAGDRRDVALRFGLCARLGSPTQCSFRPARDGGLGGSLALTARRGQSANGELVVFGTVRDVGEKAHVAEALQRSESHLEKVFSQTMVGVLHRARDGDVLMVNDRYLELIGRTAEELSAVSFEAFTHPDDLARNSRIFRRKQAKGEPFTIIKRYIRPDGGIVWCEVNVSFVCDCDGQWNSAIVFAHDITARRSAEEERKRAREMLALALDGAGAGTWEADLANNGQIQLSPSALRIYGLPKDHSGSLSHEEWAALLDPTSLAKLAEEFETFLSSRQPHTAEFRIHAPDGAERWLRVHGRATFDDKGNAQKIAGLVFDDSERKRAEGELRESETSLRLTQEAARIGTFVAQIDGQTTGSSQFFRNLGFPEDSVSIGEEDRVRLFHPEDKQRVLQDITRAIQAGTDFYETEYRILRADNGEERWMLARVRPERDKNGTLVRLLGAHLDITESKIAALKLRDTENLNRGIVESSTDCIKVLDVDGTLRYMSPTGLAALDVDDPESILNTRWQDLWPDDALPIVEEAISLACSGQVGRFNAGCISRKGNRKWLDVVVTPLKNEAGVVTQLLSITRDVTELHDQTERVRWAAEHDTLTGLPNRNYFDAQLKEVLASAKRSGERVGLVALDVDNFKQVNDAFGHDAGDALLKTLAQRVQGLLEESDFAARIGGDEFAVVVRHLEQRRDILEISEAISTQLKQPVAHRNHVLDCRVSIGVATFPEHGGVSDKLLKSADIALYAAKKGAGKSILLFEKSLRSELDRRIAMIGMAKSALDRDDVVPFYQPKVCLRTGRIEGFEALLRWRDPSGEVHFPAEIEAAFEDLDLAHEISERMQDRVLGDIRTWLDCGLDVGQIAINAAAAEFSRNDFASRLLGKLDASGVSARHLQVEVTETVFMGRGADHVGSALRTLKANGVDIALDDFGTGYASLSHLKNFPVDTIKIDRSFITDLGTNTGDTAIVCALLGLASDLNMTVVAEGIETAAQAAFLRERSCDLGQGYFFGKAVSATLVPQLIGTSNQIREDCQVD